MYFMFITTGQQVFDVWTALMRLLQDEDCDVRSKMAEIILKLQCHLSSIEPSIMTGSLIIGIISRIGPFKCY